MYRPGPSRGGQDFSRGGRAPPGPTLATALIPQQTPHQVPRGSCPACGGRFALRKDGYVWAHHANGSACPGGVSLSTDGTQGSASASTSDVASASPITAGTGGELSDQAHPFATPSRIRLTDQEREEFLQLQINTAIVLDYTSMVAKAVRSALSAAAVESNFDSLLALKPVLAAAPNHRRGELHKRRLDLFFNGNVGGLLTEARSAGRRPADRRLPPKRGVGREEPDVHAMAALSAGMPGRALRRLSQNSSPATSADAFNELQRLHPVADDPTPCQDTLNSPILCHSHVSAALRGMRLSAPGPWGLRADHLLLAYPSGAAPNLISVLQCIADGRAPRWLADARLLAIPKKGGGVRPIAVGEILRRLSAAALINGSLGSLPPLPSVCFAEGRLHNGGFVSQSSPRIDGVK